MQGFGFVGQKILPSLLEIYGKMINFIIFCYLFDVADLAILNEILNVILNVIGI